MKKRIRPMVPALGALVLLCAAYGIIARQQGRNAESQALSPENASVYITDLPELSSLSWTKDARVCPLPGKAVPGTIKGIRSCPIRQYPLTTLSDTLSHLKAERKLEGADSPEAYGLDNPSVRFDTLSSDGSSHSILVGSQVPGTGGSGPDGSQLPAQYYAAMNGDSQIYTIGSYLTETAAKGLYDFVETESLPPCAGATSGKSPYPGTDRPDGSVRRPWMTQAISPGIRTPTRTRPTAWMTMALLIIWRMP